MNGTDERQPLLPSAVSSKSSPSDSEPRFQRLKSHFAQTIPHDRATLPLTIQCFVTGIVASIFTSASGVWVPFMTGTIIQLVNSVTYYMLPADARAHLPYPTHVPERAVALGMFMVGCFTSGRFGTRTRAKLVGVSLAQAVISVAMWSMMVGGGWSGDEGAGASRVKGFPIPVIGAIAFTMGLQAASSSAYASPAFSTTVAFTASMAQVLTFPFHPQTPLRTLSLVSLVVGAGAGNLMADPTRALGWIGLLKFALTAAWAWV